MKTYFLVITKVPDQNSGSKGNMATVMDLYWDLGNDKELKRWYDAAEDILGIPASEAILLQLTSFRRPVFVAGEILVVGTDGREIGGHLRKPSKWEVEFKLFDNIEDAVELAEQVTAEGTWGGEVQDVRVMGERKTESGGQ